MLINTYVSMPLVGLYPFLQNGSQSKSCSYACVNALSRALSISTYNCASYAGISGMCQCP